jgi:hypothetical protein
LLAALVVVVLAALFAATAVAAVTARHSIGAADRGGSRADAAAWQALDEQTARLRWRPWAADAPLSAAAWPTQDIIVQGEARGSFSEVRAEVELRLPRWCAGLVTGGDVELEAPVTGVNSGAYVGGSLRGREQGECGPEPSVPGLVGPADLVRGNLWAVCAVHALGGIWAAAEEIHEAAGGSGVINPAYAADTDVHSGEDAIAELAEARMPPGSRRCASRLRRRVRLWSMECLTSRFCRRRRPVRRQPISRRRLRVTSSG